MWPNDTFILDLAKPSIKASEGFSAKPYMDAGHPANGYGTHNYPSGMPVTMYDREIDTGFAEACLTADCTKRLTAMSERITRAPTVHQAAALLSFAYNEGVPALLGSTLVSLFDHNDTTGAADQFGKWVYGHVNGKFVVIPGLVKRRAAERAMFLTPDAAIA